MSPILLQAYLRKGWYMYDAFYSFISLISWSDFFLNLFKAKILKKFFWKNGSNSSSTMCFVDWQIMNCHLRWKTDSQEVHLANGTLHTTIQRRKRKTSTLTAGTILLSLSHVSLPVKIKGSCEPAHEWIGLVKRLSKMHDIGYKEYLVGEVRQEAFNQILMHKLIV